MSSYEIMKQEKWCKLFAIGLKQFGLLLSLQILVMDIVFKKGKNQAGVIVKQVEHFLACDRQVFNFQYLNGLLCTEMCDP